MKFRLFLFLSIICSSADAQSWQCRNDMEIRCTLGKCEVEAKSGFTPMSVSFDDSGSMSICAYSGCWEGTGKVFKSGDFIMLAGHNLKSSTSPDNAEKISISLDRKDNVAVLKAGVFAHPLNCNASEQRADVPTFEQNAVNVSSAKPKPIVLSGNKDAKMFRTRLRKSLKGGVNFAGHYIFAHWGCGSSCVHGAIINTLTGIVYFPAELAGIGIGIGVGGVEIADKPLQYRKDSKLFILSGYAADAKESGVTYLVWEGTHFRLAKFFQGKQ
jgi:hypothetical protein